MQAPSWLTATEHTSVLVSICKIHDILWLLFYKTRLCEAAHGSPAVIDISYNFCKDNANRMVYKIKSFIFACRSPNFNARTAYRRKTRNSLTACSHVHIVHTPLRRGTHGNSPPGTAKDRRHKTGQLHTEACQQNRAFSLHLIIYIHLLGRG